VDGWWTSKKLSCSQTAARVNLVTGCTRPRGKPVSASYAFLFRTC
jgi:hypothetical protein